MALKYIHIFFQATVSNNPSNDEELSFDASCLAEKSFWHRICRSFESTLSLSDFRSSRINPHSSNQSTVKKNKIIIFLFFLLRIISRMIGIFEEKFVFIIVGISLFTNPIARSIFRSSDWQEDRVPAGITRVVEEHWWPHRHQRKWRNMLQVNRHVIENFNLYILQEIISVIPKLRIGRYNLTKITV